MVWIENHFVPPPLDSIIRPSGGVVEYPDCLDATLPSHLVSD